jgi:hypothetical protein
MLDKNKKKERQTWQGFYPRRTKTKAEKIRSTSRKHKGKEFQE